jgi:hypothetical protein
LLAPVKHVVVVGLHDMESRAAIKYILFPPRIKVLCLELENFKKYLHEGTLIDLAVAM